MCIRAAVCTTPESKGIMFIVIIIMLIMTTSRL